ncbi:MAG: hypothetical protein IIA75_10215 [Proteobacteria bacterium]|nr:hypothetical protein [Pseudomonadota bacterium]
MRELASSHIRLLTGIPRSGTTLCCHLLNRFENTVALHEPMAMDVFGGLTDPGEACDLITQFALDSRYTLLHEGAAASKQIGGKIPTNPIEEKPHDGSLRREQVESGKIEIQSTINDNFTLVIKHNAMFTALLPQLKQKFDCYAVVRNPLAILASWNTIDLPVNMGRIPAGERFAPDLTRELDCADDVVDRQLLVLSWFFGQFLKHIPADNILRYESIIETNGGCLSKLANNRANAGTQLQNKNSNVLYDAQSMQHLYKKLSKSDGQYWSFYQLNDIEDLMKSHQA